MKKNVTGWCVLCCFVGQEDGGAEEVGTAVHKRGKAGEWYLLEVLE